MDKDTPFNLTIFTDSTKKVCMCSATSIIIIVLFVISPLSNFFKTSLVMKILALLLMLYTIYLNINQTNLLREANLYSKNENVKSQLNINIICSYVFTLFIGLLIIFLVKSFF
jgi:hypothetical protein